MKVKPEITPSDLGRAMQKLDKRTSEDRAIVGTKNWDSMTKKEQVDKLLKMKKGYNKHYKSKTSLA